MKKYLKLRKHSLENMTDKPVCDKGLVFPDKLIRLSKTRVSNARGSPQGMLMPGTRGRDKIANAPPPGLTT